jgi:hypothetical protein
MQTLRGWFGKGAESASAALPVRLGGYGSSGSGSAVKGFDQPLFWVVAALLLWGLGECAHVLRSFLARAHAAGQRRLFLDPDGNAYATKKDAAKATGRDDLKDLNVQPVWLGDPVAPAIEGDNSLSIVANYEMGKQDVVLVQNDGGSACPALFRFLTITGSGVRVSPEFGTCTDIIYPTLDDKGGVNVAMPDFSGPFEPASKQPPARLSTKVFRYLGGQLFENGKVVK